MFVFLTTEQSDLDAAAPVTLVHWAGKTGSLRKKQQCGAHAPCRWGGVGSAGLRMAKGRLSTARLKGKASAGPELGRDCPWHFTLLPHCETRRREPRDFH